MRNRGLVLALCLAFAPSALPAQSVTPDSVRALLRALYAPPAGQSRARVAAARRHAQAWVAAHPDDGAGHAALALAWFNNGTGGFALNDSALAHASRVGDDPDLRADMVGIYGTAAGDHQKGFLYAATRFDTAAAWARGPTRDQPQINAAGWYIASRPSYWLRLVADELDRAERTGDCELARRAAGYLAHADSLYAAVDAESARLDPHFDTYRGGAVRHQRERQAAISAAVCRSGG